MPSTSGMPAGFLAIAVVTFVSTLGFGLIAPVLPTYVEVLGLSNASGSLLLSSYAIGRVAMTMPSGPVVHRFGLRRVAIGSCVIAGWSSLAAALAVHSYATILAAMFVQGMVQAVFTTAALTAVMEGAEHRNVGRAVANFQALITIAMLFAPTIGGIAGTLLGPAGPFWVGVVGGVIGTGFAVRSMPAGLIRARRREPGQATRERRGRIVQALHSRAFIFSFLAAFGGMWSVGGVRNTLLPLFASSDLGLNEAGTGLLLTVAAFGGILALAPAGWAIDRLGRRPVLRWGTMVGALATAATGLTTVLWLVGALAVLAQASKSLLGPGQATVVADISDEDTRATMVGFSRLSNSLGAATGPVMAGWFADQAGVRPAFVLAGVFLTAIALSVRAMPETGPRAPRRSGA